MGLPSRGDIVGTNYKILQLLGQGGMGAVFQAEHLWTHRQVALKVLLTTGNTVEAPASEATQRFLQEARVSTRIQHPNIVQVLDMGQSVDGTLYIVQELLEGQTLAQRLAQHGSLSTKDCLELMFPIFSALSAAHGLGIVHRDVKPSNIFLTTSHQHKTVPKLIDFGVSKVIDEHALAQTKTGVPMGTPYYMSPEQIRGDKNIDARSDIWSVGVVIYELLTNKKPFSSPTYHGLMYQILSTEVPSLITVIPQISAQFSEVIQRALSKDANERWPDLLSMFTALLSVPEVTIDNGWSDYLKSLWIEPKSAPLPPTPTQPDNSIGYWETVQSANVKQPTPVVDHTLSTASPMKEPSELLPPAQSLTHLHNKRIVPVMAVLGSAVVLLVVGYAAFFRAKPTIRSQVTPVLTSQFDASTAVDSTVSHRDAHMDRVVLDRSRTPDSGRTDGESRFPDNERSTAIRLLIHGQLPMYSYCFESARNRHPVRFPSDQLSITLHFSIAPQGTVTQANIPELHALAPDIENCIRTQLLRLTFPATEGTEDTRVTYPITIDFSR